MSIYFIGGEMGAYIPSDGNAYESNSDPNAYESGFSRGYLRCTGRVSYVESASHSALDSLWVHFAITDGAGVTGATDVKPMVLANAAGTELFRVNWSSSGGTMSLEYWNGSAWATAGSSFTINANTAVQHCDLNVVGNSASGSCQLLVAGTTRASATGVDLSAVKSITKHRSYGIGSSTSAQALSQVVVADESTVGMRVLTRYPNGAGANSDWTGTYADVDELVYSDADFLNSATANQVSMFTQTGPTITGYSVRAVAVAARAHCGASGPQNLQLALRSSGTNYFSSSKALSAGYSANINIWETNPATSAAWVNTAIDALQPGVKSIA
jgi:hypothetical protein